MKNDSLKLLLIGLIEFSAYDDEPVLFGRMEKLSMIRGTHNFGATKI